MDTPILTAIDTLSGRESATARWLRRAGPIAARRQRRTGRKEAA